MTTAKTTSDTSSKRPIALLDGFALSQICASLRWQALVMESAPFQDGEALRHSASRAFQQLEEKDWLEAFAGHPMIGDLASLEKKYAQGRALSEKEQSQVASADRETLERLLTLNQRYREKFGFIFIVCATNKSAKEMLALLESRIGRSREVELREAAQEQIKISQIRMEAYL